MSDYLPMGRVQENVGGRSRSRGFKAGGAARLLIATSLVLAACGGGSDGATSATTTTAVPLTVEYRTTLFSPAFTLRLPDKRWTVVERDAGAVQTYIPCRSCEDDGEEHGEVTFDMGLATRSPKQAIERLTEGANLRPGRVTAVTIGPVHGYRFTGSRVGPGDVLFQDSGYHTEPRGAPIEVFAVAAAGQTVTIFIDPHKSKGAALARFEAAGAAIVRAVRFG